MKEAAKVSLSADVCKRPRSRNPEPGAFCLQIDRGHYLYLYMEKVFGFGNKANLCLAALNGGTYNAVWAGTGVVAYFTGGAMLDRLGLQALFYVPMALLITELALTFWLADRVRRTRDRGGDLGSGQSNRDGIGILRSNRPDLLLLAVLLDGHERNQWRAWRHPRIGHWSGQLRRPGSRSCGTAIPSAIQP